MNAPADLSLSAWLRDGTREEHARVDAAYGRFDLADAAGYAAYLTAQARVLPEIERLLRPAELLRDWQGRAGALGADLAALARPLPAPAAVALPAGESARWGALYVLEGSRLGGAFLGRALPAGLPRAFLDAIHRPGQWRALLARLDESGSNRAAALAGARAVFRAFALAASPAG